LGTYGRKSSIRGRRIMEKKEYLIEITYNESGESEVTTLKTDDLAWSMNQYQPDYILNTSRLQMILWLPRNN